ncbi:MAG: IS66 family transposase [Planctomycetes bacterium]|nr:IS66 family transposase [Planctomycetota bacterium]
MTDKDAFIAQLQDENRQLREMIRRLQEELARLKKNSGNSSKPPSSDIVKPQKCADKRRKKRKRGAQPGHRKNTRISFAPEQVDKVIEYEFRATDAEALEPLDDWYVVQQVTLPEKCYTVVEHRARKYRDPRTGRIHIAPMPDEIRTGGLLGADITAAIAFMKGACHMSYSTIQQFFKEVIRLELSRGVLCKATQKVSQALSGPYQQLLDYLPHASHLGIDETGHKDAGRLHWTWCFQTPLYSLFHIDASRGSKVLIRILGEDFAGIIGCDYWGAYRKYARLFNVWVQYCMAHLIRDIRFLTDSGVKPLARWGQTLLAWLKKLFDTLHRRARYREPTFTRKMLTIKQGFLKRMRRPPDHALAKKLARRFKGRAAENYFRFLAEPAIEPTNNSTEREIRHTVIDRRITQGTRGQAGIQWCQRIWTTIATCKKQQQNVFRFIHQCLIAHWTDSPCP